jgi:hypothetical protein
MQGHMVPMDQPKAALDMISRFTRGKPLGPPVPSASASVGRQQAAQEQAVLPS